MPIVDVMLAVLVLYEGGVVKCCGLGRRDGDAIEMRVERVQGQIRDGGDAPGFFRGWWVWGLVWFLGGFWWGVFLVGGS